ncbi:hypothetical protein EJB05_18614, partial [Eragrostis curvula]
MATRKRQHSFSLPDATLRPPALAPDNDDGAEIPWVLLEDYAYVAELYNATTAESTTWDGKRIQVTLCLARPPRVSYVCVYCPGLDHTEFPLAPEILATEEDLVLLRIIVSSRRDILKDMDYYIYQAAAGGPSLTRLVRPPSRYGFNSYSVGILRLHSASTDDSYVVAALCRSPSLDPGQFVLCHYNSKVPNSWSTDSVSLNEEQKLQFDSHVNSKVIVIGGDAGTMGFVDLWQGILFCDVLKVVEGSKPIPSLRYVALPPSILPGRYKGGDPRLSRDIAVVKDKEGHMIKFVALQIHWKPGQSPFDKDGWVSRTWKRPVSATCLEEDAWVVVCTRESSHIPVDRNPHFQVLPKLLDREGKPMAPFRGIDVCQPTLSLSEDNGTVYFMAKKNQYDEKAWVIAVDMRTNQLQGVAEFAAERTVFIRFAYAHSRISEYLTMRATV